MIRAVKLAGSQAALGRAIGRRQSAIWNFLQTGRPDPEACADIERETGVRAAALRPDLAAIFGRVDRVHIRQTSAQRFQARAKTWAVDAS